MTDLENREAFETWYIENYHDGDIFPNNEILDFNGHHNEYRDSSLNMLWDSWQASTQRQGFKLAPLEPSAELVNHGHQVFLGHFNEGGQTGGRSLYYAYKAMIDAV